MIDGRQPAASFWSSYRKKRSPESGVWGGAVGRPRAATTAAGNVRGDAPERPGARAYDIKHYNYYLNSSRMAPGVAAAPLPSSDPFWLCLPSLPLLSQSLSLFLSLCATSL